ncbi:MAG: choice-of-anchor D domain-containing protein [Mycobacterium sp.]
MLYSFCSVSGCTDGWNPYAGLIQDTAGNLYGTTIYGGDTQGGAVFELAASGPTPTVTLSPTSLNFGTQPINTPCVAKTVTVKSTGTGTLDISNIGITPITPGTNFKISSNTCGSTLAAGKSCKVSVEFEPTALGALTASLVFTDNASNSLQTVALSGTGIEPATLTPAKAAYAKQKVGTTSAAKTFTLTNEQSVELTSIKISTTGDFALLATTCTTTLAAKEKCRISVTFKPTEIGTRTGELKVSDSAGNSPQTASLTGTGD